MTAPDPTPDPPRPLDYHQDEVSAGRRGVQILMLMVGMAAGLATTVVVGVLAYAVADDPRSARTTSVVLGGAFGLAAVGSVVAAVRVVRGGRQLTVERRSRAGRFLLLGLLIGCGVAALLEGICYGAGGPGPL